MMGLMTLEEKIQPRAVLSLSCHVRTQGEGEHPLDKPGGERAPETDSPGTLMLEF